MLPLGLLPLAATSCHLDGCWYCCCWCLLPQLLLSMLLPVRAACAAGHAAACMHCVRCRPCCFLYALRALLTMLPVCAACGTAVYAAACTRCVRCRQVLTWDKYVDVLATRHGITATGAAL